MRQGTSGPPPESGPVLGIDPGLDTTGYAVLELGGTVPRVHEAGIIRTTPDESLESRIEQIYDGVREIITGFHPAAMAVEQLHSTYAHPQTAILMGHARGVICLAATQETVPIASYRPTRVKKLLTGSGRASKAQMQRAVQQLLRLRAIPEPADVADAIAVALCHLHTVRALAHFFPSGK
jgi:crossover junction endodeoxyribonuclease RuvC